MAGWLDCNPNKKRMQSTGAVAVSRAAQHLGATEMATSFHIAYRYYLYTECGAKCRRPSFGIVNKTMTTKRSLPNTPTHIYMALK